MLPAIHNTKILMVDTSPAMLEVLKNFAVKHGFDFDSYSDPEDAVAVIDRRVEQFQQDFRCVVLGWPPGDGAIVGNLIDVLNSSDNGDLPLIIVSQEITPQIKALTRRRARTSALLWKDYQQAADQIERLPLVRRAPATESAAPSGKNSKSPPECKKSENGFEALLIDSAPSVSQTLKKLMTDNGYEIVVAESVEAATNILGERHFDLIVSDYQIHEAGGSNQLSSFCECLRANDANTLLIVVSARYTDRIIKYSLSVGAVACLFKNESTDLMFARIHAMAQSLGRTSDHNASNGAGTDRVESDAPQLLDAEKLSEATPGTAVDGRAPVLDTHAADSDDIGDGSSVLESSGKPVSAEEFSSELKKTLELVESEQHGGIRYSVLMLDVQIEAGTGDRMSIGDSKPMCEIIERSLSRLYKRPGSLSYLGNGQFVLLLANRRFQDALMLTRKVLQLVPRMVRYLNDMTLVSHAAVVRIDGSTNTPRELLEQCRVSIAKTRKDRRDNCALVMPVQKYLTALDIDSETDRKTPERRTATLAKITW